MKKIETYLRGKGDSFERVSRICSAIQKRVEEKARLSLWESDKTELDAVSTEEERAVVYMVSFYSGCSNSGRIYPHLDAGLFLIPALEAAGAHSTVKALRELQEFRRSGAELRDCDAVAEIERQVPGDFEWADPILEYVRSNRDRFFLHR